jgi:hypothetical protein
MAMNISRQIKLRSVEQAIFQPSYNRLNFFIQPDGLSTDLSQSYLSARVYLTNATTNVQLTPADMRALIAANLVVSFGNNDQSYTPACMIRTARLFANKGNELLEEVNFSNVLTQTIMNQLCNDFETIEGNNLLTGSSVQIGHGSSFPASLSAFINNPTTVHIFLRDIFGICRHSNFELAETDGLQIQLELEDKQSLFKITSLGDFQRINVPDISGATTRAVLPATFVNPAATGYRQGTNSWARKSTANGQFVAPSSDLFVDPSGNTMIQYPKEGFYFSADQWFEQPTANALIDSLTLSSAYTADQLTSLGFVVGNVMKLKYDINSSYIGAANVEPVSFEYMVTITTVTAGANPVIAWVNTAGLWWTKLVGQTINDLVTFKGMELLYANEALVKIIVDSATALTTKLTTNQLTYDASGVEQLQSLGLLDLQLYPTGISFDIGVQVLTGVPTANAGSHICQDYITNELSPQIRKVYSNQITKLPAQGAKSRIVNVSGRDASGNVTVTFSSWGCEAATSIQSATLQVTGDSTYTTTPAIALIFVIWNVENHKRGPNSVSEPVIQDLYNNLSYQIDKFELVLVQSSIDPRNRMAKPFVYSTFKVEIATIETAQPTYSRQFILEEGVYNTFLLTPQWNAVGTDTGSMISTRRGVSHYRYSVNNINQTNRDIYLSDFRSSYPSSLYLDRLNDTFNNSDYILRSPTGIKGVAETADPTIIYPLKIYKAVSETEYMLGHPGGATVQINLFSDTAMGAKIVPGNIYFFKSLLKQLA